MMIGLDPKVEIIPPKYTKAEIGQAKANLQRALRAGKKLKKKLKAKRRKEELSANQDSSM